MANEHSGHRARLRDRVRKEGLDHFQNYQVLEYALTFTIPYKDTNVVAHKLINKFGSLAGVLEADEEDLKTVDGISEVSAHFLANLLKIYHFYEKDKVGQKVKIISPLDSYNFVKQFLKGKLVEEIYIVCVNANNKVEAVEKIAEGSANETTVSIRKIIERMTKAKVGNVIVAHNHPKGSHEPSKQDDYFTKSLLIALTLNGYHFMDHIIIGEKDEIVDYDENGYPIVSSYYSYRNSGRMEIFEKEIGSLLNGSKVAQPRAKYEVDK